MTHDFTSWKLVPTKKEMQVLQRIELALERGADYVADELAKTFLYSSTTNAATRRRAYALIAISTRRS